MMYKLLLWKIKCQHADSCVFHALILKLFFEHILYKMLGDIRALNMVRLYLPLNSLFFSIIY